MKLPCLHSNIALVEILSCKSGAYNLTSMYARGAYSGTTEVRGSNQLSEEKTELMTTGGGEMGEILLEGEPKVTFRRGLFLKGRTRKKKVNCRLHRSICD